MIAAGLHGAFLLARGRAEGLAFIEATPAGAARSFWAAAICLPGYLALRLFDWAAGGLPSGAGPGRALLVELIGYVCTWAGFALASRPLAAAMGRIGAWPRFLAAWNWTAVVQTLVMLAVTLPAMLGLPAPLADALGLVALGYALWLEWAVARAALGIGAVPALAFILLDLAIGLFLLGLGWHLAGG